METKNIIEKIASYQKATQSLLDKVEEFEEFIKKNVPFELWEQFNIHQFGGGQNEGWHIALYNYEDEKKLIPGTTDKFAKGFYWGGDFNYWYNYCTSKELIEWSKNLPDLIKEATDKIEELTKQAEAVK